MKYYYFLVISLLILCSCNEKRTPLEQRAIDGVKKCFEKISTNDNYKISDISIVESFDSLCIVDFCVHDLVSSTTRVMEYGRLVISDSNGADEYDYIVNKQLGACATADKCKDIYPSTSREERLYIAALLCYQSFEEICSRTENEYTMHDENGFVWYEYIKNGKHGIVDENGTIVIEAMYDSIFYTYPQNSQHPNRLDEELELFFSYKDTEGKNKVGVAVANKDFEYIVSPKLFCSKVYKSIVSKEPLVYYYLILYEGKLDSKKKWGWGAVDGVGNLVLFPIFSIVTYDDTKTRNGWKGVNFRDNFRVSLYNYPENRAFDRILTLLSIDRNDNIVYDAITELNDSHFWGIYREEKKVKPNGQVKYYDDENTSYIEILLNGDKLYESYSRRNIPLYYAGNDDNGSMIYRSEEDSDIWYEIGKDNNLAIYKERSKGKEVTYYTYIGQTLINRYKSYQKELTEKYQNTIKELARINNIQ